MTADLDNLVSVKFLFDKEKNQVVCAEASSDFIDILFSFLTLPMGTVARLVQKHKSSLQLGFLNLYRSVISLSYDKFSIDPCKDMLMFPKNSLEPICKGLKVNLDDSPMQYFLCADVACWEKKLSYYKNAKCSCAKLLNREVFYKGILEVKELAPQKQIVEVFVKRSTRYFITENMKIICGTPGVLIEMLRERGIDNVNVIEEKVLKVGPEEILNLLVHTLISNTPLTDSFFPIQKLNSERTTGEVKGHQLTSNGTSVKASDKRVEIKIFVRKSDKKHVYAEAFEDFVELLFSFLTIPLSNVVNCLNGDSSLECIDNLYKSVKGLDDKWFTTSSYYNSSLSKNLLLNPGLAPNFNCSNESLQLCDVRDSENNGMVINKKGEFRPVSCPYPSYLCMSGEKIVKVTNPKAVRDESDLGFVKRPEMFIISDRLVVKPCDSTTSNFSFLKGLDVPIDDLEEHIVKIGKQEALSILKASLTSNSAFAPVLDLISKKRKRDDSEIILD